MSICVLKTFYKNIRNFQAHEHFHMKFDDIDSKWIIDNFWKYETKKKILVRVVTIIRLRSHFFCTTLYSVLQLININI